MTIIFYRFENGNSGWRYKYKNYVSKPYKTRQEAEDALNLRVAKLKG